jgi:hypothetical protein
VDVDIGHWYYDYLTSVNLAVGVKGLLDHHHSLSGCKRVSRLVALLRAANHYCKKVNFFQSELHSGKVPLVEGLEPTDEEASRQPTNMLPMTLF